MESKAGSMAAVRAVVSRGAVQAEGLRVGAEGSRGARAEAAEPREAAPRAVVVWAEALEVVAELSKRVQTCAPTRLLL